MQGQGCSVSDYSLKLGKQDALGPRISHRSELLRIGVIPPSDLTHSVNASDISLMVLGVVQGHDLLRDGRGQVLYIATVYSPGENSGK